MDDDTIMWIGLPRYNEEYIKVIKLFLENAFPIFSKGNEMQCPCKNCMNRKSHHHDVIYDHLICSGPSPIHVQWICDISSKKVRSTTDFKGDETGMEFVDNLDAMFNCTGMKYRVVGMCSAKYVIPDEAKKWVYTTLNDAWRGYKSRTKGKYYSRLKTEEEIIAEKPEEIPTEDFKILLKYWGDEEVQALANDNSERRCSITDTHTMDPKSLAQVKNKMRKSDPKQGTSSDVNVFIETRKRKAGRQYKTNTVVLEKNMKQLNSGNQAEADAMVCHDKEHGRNWLENLTWVLKKLGDANHDLKLDIGEFCSSVSSEDDNEIPMTQDGPCWDSG
ncbi:hypothetical protein OROMI_006425 [Orobanche minor]